MSDDAPTVEPLPAMPRQCLRRLRIAVSVFFGLLTVALCVLWVRSYWWIDTAQWTGDRVSVFAILFRGRLTFFEPGFHFGDSWSFDSNKITSSTSVNCSDGTGRPLPSYLGFQSSWLSAAVRTSASTLVIPLWFISLAAVAATFLPWLPWLSLRRFSLRTLLIATTLVAILLGLAVWAGR